VQQLSLPLTAPDPLANPTQHAELLHPSIGTRGQITIGWKTPGKRPFGWRVVSPSELPYVVKQLRGMPDYYLTQNRFYGFRSIARLAQLGALWSDLDYYKRPEWYDASPERVLKEALRLLEEAGQPPPTMAISSGRGLYVCWHHLPVPRGALPRWRACQEYIRRTLKPLGADSLARDGARILRIVGTVNTSSGGIVRFLRDPETTPTSFERLADGILPYTREQVDQFREEWTQKASQRGSRAPQELPARNIAVWWELVLSDLQGLRRERWLGDLPPGQRDAWMFVASNAISWHTEPQLLEREVCCLGWEAGAWNEGEVRSRMDAILKRARLAFKGEKVEWKGQQRDPRYWFKRQTIIDWLAIEPDEMRRAGMRALVTPEIRRENKTETERKRSYAAGEVKVTRAEYQALSRRRKERAEALKKEGWTNAQIAAELGIAVRSLQRLVNQPKT